MGDDEVIWAEYNLIMHPCATPNDPLYNDQWNLKPIAFGVDCERAWNTSRGKSKIKVGFIGSGIDASHPDLLNKVEGGHNYHLPLPPGDPWGDDGHNYGHETKVAGIAGARTNNYQGMAGIAGGWNVDLNDIGATFYSLRGTDNDGVMYADDMGRAIRNGGDDFDCDILNILWGSTTNSNAVREAIDHARAAFRILVIAMGNGGYGYEREFYPAEYEDINIIAVGSYGQDGEFCVSYDQLGNCPTSSNYGYPLDLVAPGANIATTAPGAAYDMVFGSTSAATPHVTGAAALILSDLPYLGTEDVEWLLAKTAIDVGRDGYDAHYGWGRLNIGNIYREYLSPSQYNGRVYYYFDYFTNPQLQTVAHSPWVFYEEYPLVDGQAYEAICKEAIYDVVFPDNFDSFSGVWGKSQILYYGIPTETQGWSAANPNFTTGYCEVVPGSESPTGCQLRTYYYNILINGQWYWYPADPYFQNVQLCYAVWGIKSTGNPTRPEGGKRNVSQDELSSIDYYPNPFNSQVTFEYDLAKPTSVSLDIYDIRGALVKRLVTYVQPAGHHSIIWDATNQAGLPVNSGIFFIKSQIDSKKHFSKLVLLK